ncbi:DNA-directed RNA polymerase subunit beta [Gracilibacillus sp. S3-1-1]|uniref:DNA-directed RNA polymerase subunit beta n=1 Tax=Gracilibacillus pellucidus TaxID=3095368 RepID=A0ACC6M9R0_9BACI|nr:DNA-directed RNA polymerase subunit beta [Gracilibacillus sp. S3-1-1]MDX8047613.1 DNA-directed RNA polymerase subunit beta [Gracilibacillus sp. S3-1-1]
MAEERKTKHTTKEEQAKKETRADNQEGKPKKYVRRLIPVWAKVLIVVVLSLFALMLGLIIGFSVLGDGDALDVLRLETWQHIWDFIDGK